MKKIKVNIPNHPYDVNIGTDLNNSIASFTSKLKQASQTAFVIDNRVYKLHRAKIKNLVESIHAKSLIVKIKASENEKSLDTVIRILTHLSQSNFGRDGLVVGIGGGITGDVTGFAASIYMRGISVVLVPTTLLACVDSSVGGKTGVNFRITKNSIGSFYQPSAVFIDLDYLSTLEERQLICGIGEILKYAFLADIKDFEYICKNLNALRELNETVLTRIISTTVKFKAGVVEEDEKESGLRKILNFGHTFAHALEVQQNYEMLHGEAVIVGISCALQLSHLMGTLSGEHLYEFQSILEPFYSEIRINKVDVNSVMRAMKRDKKNRKNKKKFVLLREIGKLIIDVEAADYLIKKAIKFGIKPFNS